MTATGTLRVRPTGTPRPFHRVVDGADPGGCLPDDARSAVRPQEGNNDGSAQCDAGAFELPYADRLFHSGFESQPNAFDTGAGA
jgi:hypothetical protein